ncbi:hypothetical protein Pmani_039056 [Petrolisthes manimaculis]|uniref:alpha-1,2-Mannosidase n=1 Tax=Petrolisthes manimaculis TaxID=1843537 RepID=A0AAE1NF00_9EUCA|nr:hypothetical protein Pmani_039056 [Petrolisthes manimaculis]KAK4287888.1 hypothetical protein Pmani_039056 [Petrolisthes manimaculis]
MLAGSVIEERRDYITLSLPPLQQQQQQQQTTTTSILTTIRSWRRRWKQLPRLLRGVLVILMAVVLVSLIIYNFTTIKLLGPSPLLPPSSLPPPSSLLQRHDTLSGLENNLSPPPLPPIPAQREKEIQAENSLRKVADKPEPLILEGGDQIIPPPGLPQRRSYRQEAVVSAMRHAWKGYKTYAWGHDHLKPVTRSRNDWLRLGLTLVDALDTLWIMELKEEFSEAREWVASQLNFNLNQEVNLFETTIRVLGGLLSTYHLTNDQLFLDKAIDLGDRLVLGFNSGSGVPFADVNLYSRRASKPRWGPDSSTSEVTTIQLEFRDLSRLTGKAIYEGWEGVGGFVGGLGGLGREGKRWGPDSSTSEVTTIQLEFRDLSRLTGKAIYEEKASFVSEHIHTLAKTDGLVPIFINAQTGQWRSHSTITLGARGDSYYEYLLKQWIQTGRTLDYLRDDYNQSVTGMEKHLASHTHPSRLLFFGELHGSTKNFVNKMDELTCYLPGTLALGTHYGMPRHHMDLAQRLMYTCVQTWLRQPTHLAPEITYFNIQPSPNNEDFYVKANDAHYLLRPETIESLWYLYHLTGNTTYQDWGWQLFQGIEKHCRVENGYTSIGNVRSATDTKPKDKMESFFLGETLKYLYLLFMDDQIPTVTV